MEIPTLTDTETNLRNCLLLKSDDLFFTLAEPFGEVVRDSFLGLKVTGLADEELSDEEIASIDLRRFAIAERVRLLHAMLEGRFLSLTIANRPDVEFARNDALHFLEHFLSTLPDVALGGVDMTSAAYGEVRKIYNLAFAWLNLIEAVEASFFGETESTLAVTDLALLSGLEVRTLRNRCGPDKIIRTSATRTSQDRGSASPAFVSLHTLDAVDWLKSRKDFEISPIEPHWILLQISGGRPENITRGLLIASIINLGPLDELVSILGFTSEEARNRFDIGEALPAEIIEALLKRLGAKK